MNKLFCTLSLVFASLPASCLQAAENNMLTVQAAATGKAISPDLIGVFFEDINYAADGGIYAELVQNRSFEYAATDNKKWTALTAWKLVQPQGGQSTVVIEDTAPLNPSNPRYAVLTTDKAGGGLQNTGFDGIAVNAGDTYYVSLFSRQIAGSAASLTVQLETKTGALLAEVSLPAPSVNWGKVSAALQATATDADARLVVLATAPGSVALDMVSLFPAKTFHNRPNGLRADLAQVIADLKPKFMRFPGGCIIHGHGLDNTYHWKNTIGPVEQRKGQRNLWRYHQSFGLGYFEYFQFCEDLGAKPIPVVSAGVSCQYQPGGQACLPLEQMNAYIQDVLDLIEYANGPVTSVWGAQRAAAGHPEPFNLQYLGIGNEDLITPMFKERFQMIRNAVQAKHPEITVIGTSGPYASGIDYDKAWKFAEESKLQMVDEHYYKAPQWFWKNLNRYDSFDRTKAKVYLGEYAAHDEKNEKHEKRRNTWRSALAEAAYLTGIERNADLVQFASYAPLLAKRGQTQWNPDLIYFTNTAVYPTINYDVQRLFSLNGGDRFLPTSMDAMADFAVSTVRDSRTGDVIIKLVNGATDARPLRIQLAGLTAPQLRATRTVLAADDADLINEDGKVPAVSPQTTSISIAPAFDYQAPPYSLTIFRITTR